MMQDLYNEAYNDGYADGKKAANEYLIATLETIANSDSHMGGTFVAELQAIAKIAIIKAKGGQ
jgi:hypothetical protein